MTFKRSHALLLITVAVWNVLTWSMFIKNLAEASGRPTGYYVAHTVLIVVNLVIAVLLGVLGTKAWRAARGASADG